MQHVRIKKVAIEVMKSNYDQQLSIFNFFIP
jgi:hypothetical protein